jgi:hypothetical protein
VVYDLDAYQAVGLSLVSDRGDTNAFATYRLSGRRGTEWFVILGDPSASRTVARLAFKVVVPFSIGL